MEDYRPITILNTDLKLLARILANRLSRLLCKIISGSQHCGVPGTSIFDALETIRDVIAYAEVKSKPLCVLSLDFQGASDNISHDYLDDVLRYYGFSDIFRRRLQMLYRNAHSFVQINGCKSQPIPIHSSIRQGCPLSMALYIICLNPFLSALQNELQGLRMNTRQDKVTAVAYADDVTVFLTTPTDVSKLHTIITRFEEATVAKINVCKSGALVIAAWNINLPIFNIPHKENVRILGMTVSSLTRQSADKSWATTVAKIQLRHKSPTNGH